LLFLLREYVSISIILTSALFILILLGFISKFALRVILNIGLIALGTVLVPSILISSVFIGLKFCSDKKIKFLIKLTTFVTGFILAIVTLYCLDYLSYLSMPKILRGIGVKLFNKDYQKVVEEKTTLEKKLEKESINIDEHFKKRENRIGSEILLKEDYNALNMQYRTCYAKLKLLNDTDEENLHTLDEMQKILDLMKPFFGIKEIN